MRQTTPRSLTHRPLGEGRGRVCGLAIVAAGLALLGAVPPTLASPILSLVKSGTTSATDTEALGTASEKVDVRLDTSGNAISGLQFYLVSAPAGAGTYQNVSPTSSTVLALNAPFTQADVNASPTVGATPQNAANAKTVLFKSSAGDYAAFSTTSIVTLQLNISSLAAGSYVFTPVSQGLTNASGGVAAGGFGTPGAFTLNITPEPGTFLLVLPGALAMLGRRQRRGCSATA